LATSFRSAHEAAEEQKRYNTQVLERPKGATSPQLTTEGVAHAAVARRAIAGFFLSGILYAFLGAMLPVWRHHLSGDYIQVGNYFLAVTVGIFLGSVVAPRLVAGKGITFTLTLSCAVACGAVLGLAFASPPQPAWIRVLVLWPLGVGIGMVNVALFHAVSSAYRLNPAATANLAGVTFGLGCFMVTLLVAGSFYAYTVPSILIFIALVPGFFAISYARSSMRSEKAPAQQPSWREALPDFRSMGAILFTLLLFFQFGNEGALAGWLALFLTVRLGISPESALFTLAIYWLALLVGRVATQAVLPHMNHGKLLFGSVMGAVFGCTILSATNNMFGAVTGVLMAGLSFSAILPLVVESIWVKFPYFHPAFFSGVFSIGLAGGLLAPATLGYAAQSMGIRVVTGLPLIGSWLVALLTLLIWLVSRLTSPRRAKPRT
jgi:FHS family glucose/mannose:H+ symporter-like MFS transporter